MTQITAGVRSQMLTLACFRLLEKERFTLVCNIAFGDVAVDNRDFPHSDITGAIIGAFYDVYNQLGRGFLESVYERSLYISLTEAGVVVQRQFPITVSFRGRQVGHFRADLLVEDAVIVELKVAKRLHTKHRAQLINALKATGHEVGLLLNFGARASLKRVVFSNKAHLRQSAKTGETSALKR
jgi:GxxExxY protein